MKREQVKVKRQHKFLNGLCWANCIILMIPKIMASEWEPEEMGETQSEDFKRLETSPSEEYFSQPKLLGQVPELDQVEESCSFFFSKESGASFQQFDGQFKIQPSCLSLNCRTDHSAGSSSTLPMSPSNQSSRPCSDPGSDEDDSNYEIDEEEEMEGSKNKSKGKKKGEKMTRKKDQNSCKKYNCLALRVLKKMNMDKMIKEQIKKKKYRQDFFVNVLMVVNQVEGKLAKFEKKYKEEVGNLRKSSQNELNKASNKLEQGKIKALIDGIDRTFKCIEFYQNGDLESATTVLFDKEKLKNKNFITNSIQSVSQIQKTIQTN